MDDNRHDKDADWLDKFIRLAADQAEESPVERPHEEDIDAYMDGTASDVQRQRVQEALVGSADFRKELVERAGALQQANAGARDRNDARVPWFERLAAMFRMPNVAAPAAAVIVLIAAIAVYQNKPDGEYSASLMSSVDGSAWSGSVVELSPVSSLRGGGEDDVPYNVPNVGVVMLKLPVLLFPGDPAPSVVEVETETNEVIWSTNITEEDVSNDVLYVTIDVSTFGGGDYSIRVRDTAGDIITHSLFRIESD
jgi:hypothetical protein